MPVRRFVSSKKGKKEIKSQSQIVGKHGRGDSKKPTAGYITTGKRDGAKYKGNADTQKRIHNTDCRGKGWWGNYVRGQRERDLSTKIIIKTEGPSIKRLPIETEGPSIKRLPIETEDPSIKRLPYTPELKEDQVISQEDIEKSAHSTEGALRSFSDTSLEDGSGSGNESENSSDGALRSSSEASFERGSKNESGHSSVDESGHGSGNESENSSDGVLGSSSDASFERGSKNESGYSSEDALRSSSETGLEHESGACNYWCGNDDYQEQGQEQGQDLVKNEPPEFNNWEEWPEATLSGVAKSEVQSWWGNDDYQEQGQPQQGPDLVKDEPPEFNDWEEWHEATLSGVAKSKVQSWCGDDDYQGQEQGPDLVIYEQECEYDNWQARIKSKARHSSECEDTLESSSGSNFKHGNDESGYFSKDESESESEAGDSSESELEFYDTAEYLTEGSRVEIRRIVKELSFNEDEIFFNANTEFYKVPMPHVLVCDPDSSKGKGKE